jgi:hypothetical protein
MIFQAHRFDVAMRTLTKGAFLAAIGYLIVSATECSHLVVGLVGLGLMYIVCSLALLRMVLTPTRGPRLFYERRARRLRAFAMGTLRGAQLERLGDLLRQQRNRVDLTDEELEETAAKLDRVTAAFRATNDYLGPGLMGAGRRLIRRYIMRKAGQLRQVRHKFTQRDVLRFFALAFTPVFLVLVTIFGLGYLAAWKLNPQAFASTPPMGPSLWHAWFFSMATATTSDLSPLRPDGALVQVLVATELVSGLCLITALVTCFASIHQVDLDESLRAWRHVESELAIIIEHWNEEIEKIERERGLSAETGDVKR